MTTIEGTAKKRLTARAKVARDDLIVEARLRGRSWISIASEHDLSDRQCQAIFAEWRAANPSARHRDALELLDELLEGLQGVQEECAEIAATTGHDGTRLGAIRTRMDALNQRAVLLNMVGVLPDLSTLRVEINARQMAAKIVVVLEQHAVGDEVIDAMYAALTGEGLSAAMALNRSTAY